MPAETLPPAQPAYILRGHVAQVHALHFYSDNHRLLTADADGWVVLWNLSYKRPVAVWKAHEAAILGLGTWGRDIVITHGRDSKLVVWKLAVNDEDDLGKALPVDRPGNHHRKPESLHILTVNTLNFCSFVSCWDTVSDIVPDDATLVNLDSTTVNLKAILIAVPNTLDSEGIDIFQLPSENRLSTLPPAKPFKTGMAMALDIHTKENHLRIVAAYESGHTMMFAQTQPKAPWQTIYAAQPHSQPVLSLAVCPSHSYYLTSSADAIIAKHPMSPFNYPSESSSEPTKLISTKHSGQQGLRIRSDGKIFATAGWDGRVRVYSTKTMKELAVLKWHKDGCYATEFADVGVGAAGGAAEEKAQGNETAGGKETEGAEREEKPASTAITTRSSMPLSTVSQRRDHKVRTTHWLAAGSKDGKVSLWDIY